VAELAIGKRKNLTWWPLAIFLGVVAFVAFLWMFLGRRNTPPGIVEVPTPSQPAMAGAYAGPITELGTLIRPADRDALVGREVVLESVHVSNVVGRDTYVVGPSGAQGVIVVREPVAGMPATPMEGAPQIAAGDTIAVYGKVQRMPDDEETLTRLGLDRLRTSDVSATAVIVSAIRVEEVYKRGAHERP
jgi:hypothetical protein